MYRGQTADGLTRLRALSRYEGVDYGWPATHLAETLLQLDRPAEITEIEGRILPDFRAMAFARLGRYENAEATLEPFRGARLRMGAILEELFAFEMARSRGDLPASLEHLAQAERLLDPRGPINEEIQLHVPIWYRLALTHRALGDDTEAELWLRKIVDSTSERLTFPVAYARSLYWLGQIHEDRADLEPARYWYERFLALWGGGDVDRPQLAHARSLVPLSR